MPQPDAVAASADELIKLFARSEAKLIAEQAKILALPEAERLALFRRSARVKEMLATVQGQMAALRADAAAWVTSDLPIVYQLGAEAAAETLGSAGVAGFGEFTWTQAHQGAIQNIATDLFTDVLQMTSFVAEDTKRWIRDVSKKGVAAGVIEGQTPGQIARQLVKAGAGGIGSNLTPITAVTYKNGAKHTLEEYAAMLIRTKTARAHNSGTINFAEQAGVEVFEIFDGGECSLYSHDDGPLANGLIVSGKTARDHPLGHPNCRRSFGARPDLTVDDAGEFLPSTTEAQRLDSLKFEREIKNTRQRQAARRARQKRSATSARTTRTPRAQTASTAQTTSSRVTAESQIQPTLQGEVDRLRSIGVDSSRGPLSYERDPIRGDQLSSPIADAQGFSGLPRVVNQADFDQLVQEGWQPVGRGLSGGADAPRYAEQFRTGELYTGQGLYGTGTYTSPDLRFADGYGSESMRMAIPPDAKIATTELLDDWRAENMARGKPLGGQRFSQIDADGIAAAEARESLADEISGMYRDDGRLATALGFDVLSARGGQEMLILNRTAIAVLR